MGLSAIHLVPSPVKEIKFEKWGRAQDSEKSAQCTSHVTTIIHCPAFQYLFSGEGLDSIPQSKHIADDYEGEWELIAENATNHQQAMHAHEIVDDIYRHAENLCTKAHW